jgi:hypothetical protein
MGAEEKPVKTSQLSAIRAGIVDRRTHNKGISSLEFRCHLIHNVIKHTMPQFGTTSTTDASVYIFVSNMHNLGFYAIFLKFLSHNTERCVGTTLSIGTPIK